MISHKCNLCGSDRLDLYCQSDKMLQCLDCGIVFLAPEQISTNFDSYYQDNVFYAQNATNPDLVRQMSQTAYFYLKTISRYVKDPVGKLLVDVGSNYGALVEEAVLIGFKAIGLEKNNILVEAGVKRGLNILTNDLAELEGTVDVITAMHVLEHLTDPRSFIKDVHQKLAPSGVFVIGIPNIESHLAKKDGLSWRYIALEHLFYFSKEVLTKILKQEGFEVIGVKQDGSNLTGLSIKKLLHYLMGGPITRDRFQMKSWEGRATGPQIKSSFFRSFLKRILILLIKILHREDFILIITKKSLDCAK